MARAERASETDTERTCIVTRRVRAPSDMIRFVLGPDDSVVPDLKRKLPGRGVWVGADRACVAEAVKRQLFAKGFKATARASASLPDEIDALIERDALQALSMCNKAGLVTTGAAKVEKTIAAGPIAAMLHASDGGPDGVRKIGQALTRAYGERAAGVPRIILFASAQLDLALGRSNVIHAALKSGAASEGFLGRCRRLALYRGEIGAEPSRETDELKGPEPQGSPVAAGAEDRNQRGGGPDHCHQERAEQGSAAQDCPERGSGSHVMTSGRGPGTETI